MEKSGSEPYLAAELQCEQGEFDLSGETSFDLALAITLYAKAPILICREGTFIDRNRALEDVGIIFTNRDTKVSHKGGYVCVLYKGGRPTTPDYCLEPGKTVLINIPFNGFPDKILEAGFDLRLIFNVEGFETGCTYEGRLPTDGKIKYWRWATAGESGRRGGMLAAITSVINSTLRTAVTWWKSDQGVRKSVQLSVEKKQLPIYIKGNDVVFTCVGKKMKWPAEDSEIWDHNKPGYKDRHERAEAEYVKENGKRWAEVAESNRKFRERMAAERKARGEDPWPGDQAPKAE